MKSEAQKFIVDSIIEKLKNSQVIEYADVKRINDNIDEQTEIVIICGISSINKVYPMTDDYQYKLDIAIRSWIADDQNGIIFDKVIDMVRKQLKPLSNKNFNQILNNWHFVGVVEEAETKQVTEDSNILTLSYLVYASF